MLDLRKLLGIPFSEEQMAAIEAPLAPNVVIAGAGSGKTTVMAARVVHLVGNDLVRPEQVLGLTFTRKAAAELGERVRSALRKAGLYDPEAAAEPQISTYDAFAKGLVADYGFLGGLESDARLISGVGSYRLAAEVVASWEQPLEALGEYALSTVIFMVRHLSDQLVSHLATVAQLQAHGEKFLAALEQAPLNKGKVYKDIEKAQLATRRRLELLPLVERYQQLKRERGFVEFSDLMKYAAELARLGPVGEALRGQFQVVLLDEYQDTSAAQAQLLSSLFAGHPVTAVGDPCQAIYGWRGAAAGNIVEFADLFADARGKAKAFPLATNRRSDEIVVRAANEMATQIYAQIPASLMAASPRLVPKPEAGVGELVLSGFDTVLEEREWLVAQIAQLHQSGQVAQWRDIAVLTRTNATAASMHQALAEQGIPAEIVGLDGLLQLPAVADVVATLRLLEDECANPELVRLLTSPRWAISPPVLAQLGRRARKLAADSGQPESLLAALANPGPGFPSAVYPRFKQFHAELRALRGWRTRAVGDLVQAVAGVLGAAAEYRAVGVDPTLTGLDEFYAAVAEYEAFDGSASLSGLLAYLDAVGFDGVGLEQPAVSDVDSVKLLTVHKAKGLEWDVVFLPGLTAGNFPDVRVGGNWVGRPDEIPAELRGDAQAIAQLGEVSNASLKKYHELLQDQTKLGEDRLGYVAITRARHTLFASWHAWRPGQAKPKQASEYFNLLATLADAEVPEISELNPLADTRAVYDWPYLGDAAELAVRRQVASTVRELLPQAATWVEPPPVAGLSAEQTAAYARAFDLANLLLRLERERREQPPADAGYLSVTAVARAAADPAAFATQAARPLPRLTSAAAAVGSRFHDWVQARLGAAPSFDELEPSTLDGDLAKLQAAFEASPYATLPVVAAEAPFTLHLAGKLIRGRIDAVFAPEPGKYTIVDWKTGDIRKADPIQLSIYRLAWAQLHHLPLESVTAVFYDLSKRKTATPPLLDLPSLESLLANT
ncbi:MAG: ATP-dependent helicase [Propionibacteriaceae bacterium]|jgi:DNA helicase-2/ATP-dependent DNA helicase PcrA|nr:ATP-dependent helicase [Propionibacteriaceae bacterium]